MKSNISKLATREILIFKVVSVAGETDLSLPFKLLETPKTGCVEANIKVLSHDVASMSDIRPCNEIDKPLVVYRFSKGM